MPCLFAFPPDAVFPNEPRKTNGGQAGLTAHCVTGSSGKHVTKCSPQCRSTVSLPVMRARPRSVGIPVAKPLAPLGCHANETA